MPNNSQRVTLKSVADHVGCSTPVVSKVLNGSKGSIGVGDELRERIEQVARELDYQGNYHAATLRTGRAGIIGLVYGRDYGVHTGFAGPLVDGLDVAVRREGSDLLVVGPGPDEPELERAMRYIKQGKIDALVVPSYLYRLGRDDPSLDDLPIITVLAGEIDAEAHVDVDLQPGTMALMEHLAALGHQEILWFGRHGSLEERRQLAAECAEECGMAMRVVTRQIPPANDGTPLLDRIIRANAAAFADWLSTNEPPTAVVASEEKVAFGICRALHEAGLHVPGDVSVAAYDDIRAVLCEPPLTVVSQALTAMGEAAARMALRVAEHPAGAAELLAVPRSVDSHLVIRQSTGPVPYSAAETERSAP